MFRISFDIGGTFTDFALARSGGGAFVFHKVPTTPDDPAEAVIRGLGELAKIAGFRPTDVDEILHATTVATNSILERKGATTALITTKGFRDVLLIGRQKRYDVFDLYMKKPVPLVRRRDIFEVDERILADGEVLRVLDDAEVDAVAALIAERGYESVAVALLNSYANPRHERRVQERLALRVPQLAVSVSSDVSPRYREYERVSTTVANAYVKPSVGAYLDRIQSLLTQHGYRAPLSIMQSNGGLVTPMLARHHPVRIIESGPAAGVLMCAKVGRELGLDHLLTFDMGGTTAKLGAIDHGQPAISPTFEVDMVRFLKGSGLPLNVSSIELLEIGAGGGSIAAIDMGLIKVGPASAGAKPGPMCYDAGGTQPTVTDANVVLGYIDPENFNGGAIRLNHGKACEGIERVIAVPMEFSVGRAAWGVHAMVNSAMERALRIVSIERGRDPRTYALVAFGGAGPIHAARLARQVGIRKVVVPFGAGVGSAIGLLRALPKIDIGVTRILDLRNDVAPAIAAVYAGLEERARADLQLLGVPEERVLWSRAAYMRYVGQGYDLRVDLPDPTVEGAADIERMRDLFHAAYQRNYGYRDEGVPIQATEWYLAAEWKGESGDETLDDTSDDAAARGAVHRRAAYFPEFGDYREVDVVNRAALHFGSRVVGPAIIEEREATTVILPGDVAHVGPKGHLIIDIAVPEDGQ
jgi:N-methylhydantoinase A